MGKAKPENKRVLLTGASGLIGQVLIDGLDRHYNLSGVDLKQVEGFNITVADTTRLEDIIPAFNDVDTVIDLSSYPSQNTAWLDVYENNIMSTYNALAASQKTGVRRIIFASSNHVTGMYENDLPYSAIVSGRYQNLNPKQIPYITTSMPVRPDGPYGIGKAFGESAGRYFSEQFNISVICLRIGTLVHENRPMNVRSFATLLTHNDLIQLVTKSIEAPNDLTFDIFYGVSNNKWRFWDIENSRKQIGYTPQDNAETWRSSSQDIQ